MLASSRAAGPKRAQFCGVELRHLQHVAEVASFSRPATISATDPSCGLRADSRRAAARRPRRAHPRAVAVGRELHEPRQHALIEERQVAGDDEHAVARRGRPARCRCRRWPRDQESRRRGRRARGRRNRSASVATMKTSAATRCRTSTWRTMMGRPSTTRRLLSRPPNRRACPPARIAAATVVDRAWADHDRGAYRSSAGGVPAPGHPDVLPQRSTSTNTGCTPRRCATAPSAWRRSPPCSGSCAPKARAYDRVMKRAGVAGRRVDGAVAAAVPPAHRSRAAAPAARPRRAARGGRASFEVLQRQPRRRAGAARAGSARGELVAFLRGARTRSDAALRVLCGASPRRCGTSASRRSGRSERCRAVGGSICVMRHRPRRPIGIDRPIAA